MPGAAPTKMSAAAKRNGRATVTMAPELIRPRRYYPGSMSNVLIDSDGDVARITLTRRAKANALDSATAKALRAAFLESASGASSGRGPLGWRRVLRRRGHPRDGGPRSGRRRALHPRAAPGLPRHPGAPGAGGGRGARRGSRRRPGAPRLLRPDGCGRRRDLRDAGAPRGPAFGHRGGAVAGHGGAGPGQGAAVPRRSDRRRGRGAHRPGGRGSCRQRTWRRR